MVVSAAYDPRGSLLFTGDYNGRITIWRHGLNGRWVAVSHTLAHRYGVSGLAVSRDGLIASIDAIDHTVALWEIQDDTLRERWRRTDIGISQVFAFYFNTAGTTLHASGRDGGINRPSVAKPEEIMPQIRQQRPFSSAQQAIGVRMLLHGFIYKAAIADTL